jgi:hypothetical protein
MPSREGERVADDLREVAASGSEEHRGHDVFVSYSRADRASVVALTERLTSVGKRAWVDLEDIPPSAEWMTEIHGAIAAADGYLVVVSPDLARSSVCAEELEEAVPGGKRIVPVLIRSTDPETVPDALARLNWIDATDGDLDGATERIVRALDTDLEHVKAHTRLLVRATEWQAAGEHRSALLRGRELAEAEHLTAAAEREPRPTQLQTRFVLASRKATGRRQRVIVAATSVALVVAVVLGSVALIQGGRRDGGGPRPWSSGTSHGREGSPPQPSRRSIRTPSSASCWRSRPPGSTRANRSRARSGRRSTPRTSRSSSAVTTARWGTSRSLRTDTRWSPSARTAGSWSGMRRRVP